MMLAKGLGIVPSWVFSNDPAINPNVNPHVNFPPGWTQQTIQPVGDFYAPPGTGMAGLGATVVPVGQRVRVQMNSCCDSCTCGNGDPCCGSLRTGLRKMGITQGVSGFGDILPGTGPIEDASWVVKHRTAITIGGIALLGLAALGGLGVLFR